MNGVNVARFEHDLDTTWAAYFTDADLNIYSRFGGRDETSSESRLRKSALLRTMTEVLDVHARRLQRGASGPDEDTQPVASTSVTPEDIPLLKANHQGCIHCHQVQEYRYLQAFHDGKFSRRDVFGYPLPENIGIRFDPDHGHQIAELIAGGPAEKAGLRPGDVVTRVNNVPVHSEQDVRWALHRADDRKPVVITAARAAPVAGDVRVELSLTGNWRQTELGWRKSLRSVPLALGFLGYELGREERSKAGLSPKQLAIRVISVRGPGLAKNLGLQKDDLIVSIDEAEASRTFDEFKSELLRRYEPGATVRLKIQREGKPVVVTGPFPEWYTEDNSVP